MRKTDSLEKMPDKIEGRRRMGTKEDEMVRRHHQLDGHEFEQASGVGDSRQAWHAAVLGIAKSQT